MRITGVRVVRGQFADGRAVFAFGDGGGCEGDVVRRVVLGGRCVFGDCGAVVGVVVTLDVGAGDAFCPRLNPVFAGARPVGGEGVVVYVERGFFGAALAVDGDERGVAVAVLFQHVAADVVGFGVAGEADDFAFVVARVDLYAVVFDGDAAAQRAVVFGLGDVDE